MEQDYCVFAIDTVYFAIESQLIDYNKEQHINNRYTDIKVDNTINLRYCISNADIDDFCIIFLKNSISLIVDSIIGIITIKHYEIKWFEKEAQSNDKQIINGVSRRKMGNIYILNENYLFLHNKYCRTRCYESS